MGVENGASPLGCSVVETTHSSRIHINLPSHSHIKFCLHHDDLLFYLLKVSCTILPFCFETSRMFVFHFLGNSARVRSWEGLLQVRLVEGGKRVQAIVSTFKVTTESSHFCFSTESSDGRKHQLTGKVKADSMAVLTKTFGQVCHLQLSIQHNMEETGKPFNFFKPLFE